MKHWKRYTRVLARYFRARQQRFRAITLYKTKKACSGICSDANKQSSSKNREQTAPGTESGLLLRTRIALGLCAPLFRISHSRVPIRADQQRLWCWRCSPGLGLQEHHGTCWKGWASPRGNFRHGLTICALKPAPLMLAHGEVWQALSVP